MDNVTMASGTLLLGPILAAKLLGSAGVPGVVAVVIRWAVHR